MSFNLDPADEFSACLEDLIRRTRTRINSRREAGPHGDCFRERLRDSIDRVRITPGKVPMADESRQRFDGKGLSTDAGPGGAFDELAKLVAIWPVLTGATRAAILRLAYAGARGGSSPAREDVGQDVACRPHDSELGEARRSTAT